MGVCAGVGVSVGVGVGVGVVGSRYRNRWVCMAVGVGVCVGEWAHTSDKRIAHDA